MGAKSPTALVDETVEIDTLVRSSALIIRRRDAIKEDDTYGMLEQFISSFSQVVEDIME